MGKKKRKDLIKENLTNTDVTNTDVGFGEMAIQQTITNCSDIGKNTDAIVERIGAKLKNIGAIEERIGAKLDRLIEWFEREQEARDRPLLEEKAAVIIQAFLRTTAVRVKIDRAEHLWGRKNVDAKMYVPGYSATPFGYDTPPFALGAAVRERACGHLNGKWMNLESDGSTMEVVHVKRGLVYDGLEEPFLTYVGTDPDDYLVFEFGDGDRVRAKKRGDTLEWSDGSVYYKLPERVEPEGGSSSSLFEGNWKTWNKYGVKEGTVTIQDLDPSGCEAHFLLLQWDDDSSPVKLRFTGREGDRFSFECHGDADTAVFVSDGDRIIWGDGCVYMRIRTPEKDVDIVGTTISEKILESGTADTNSPGASGDDAIDFERTEEVA